MMTDLPRDIALVVDIDDQDLHGEYSRAAHHLAAWGVQYADAQREFLLAKTARERTEARLRLSLREEYEASGKKATEATVDALLKTHPDYEADKLAEVEAEAESLRVRGVLNAVKTKCDMLVSLGATQRAEMRA